ncbi:Hypothetical protein KNT65_gp249 [Escherichia phage EcS1]|uniref:Uncharacterized protein n=1 Tax=Escherichia phage EcS1 TaxID=2083276 RepID=A0A2Z5ZCP7_9CAUD|nr:Hypothetical protein KNT65_gp249 [Escherichia phage EcS1]BBC78244.1 Hypothetical protein [Escherichia phage EcS1]
MTRTTKLATYYGAIADSISSSEYTELKKDFEKCITDVAKQGRREFHYYPLKNVSKFSKYKDVFLKWLEDEGIEAKWRSCQRDGEWVEIKF